MATQTGKKARKSAGNRYACKRMKTKNPRRKTFGQLPISEKRGNAAPLRSGDLDPILTKPRDMSDALRDFDRFNP